MTKGPVLRDNKSVSDACFEIVIEKLIKEGNILFKKSNIAKEAQLHRSSSNIAYKVFQWNLSSISVCKNDIDGIPMLDRTYHLWRNS